MAGGDELGGGRGRAEFIAAGAGAGAIAVGGGGDSATFLRAPPLSLPSLFPSALQNQKFVSIMLMKITQKEKLMCVC